LLEQSHACSAANANFHDNDFTGQANEGYKSRNPDIHINCLPETCIRVNQTRNDRASMTSKFAPFKEAIIGQRITHVWRGHGSTLFIEFGHLTQRTKRDGTPGQPHGEITLMVEWSWRIEKIRSIVGEAGATSGDGHPCSKNSLVLRCRTSSCSGRYLKSG
jgi:hypothetical protein